MDPVVNGPFMLARDDTPINWREKGIMQAVLRPEDVADVRRMACGFAEESLRRAAPTGHIEVVNRLGRYVPIRLCDVHFGFPGPDLKTMYRWSRATQADMFKNLQNDPAVHEASLRAGKEMSGYLAHLIKEKVTGLASGERADLPRAPGQRGRGAAGIPAGSVARYLGHSLCQVRWLIHGRKVIGS